MMVSQDKYCDSAMIRFQHHVNIQFPVIKLNDEITIFNVNKSG